MAVFRVQSYMGALQNPDYPRRNVSELLNKQINHFNQAPRISIQLPARHQSTLFTFKPSDPDTLIIDFRWLGYHTALHAITNISAAYEKAEKEALGLAKLINVLRLISPESPVDVVAHRLGARVALMAVPSARSKMWRNLILSNAFEYSARTLHALDCPMGKHLNIYNLVSQQFNLSAFLFNHFSPKPGPADHAICFGYQFPHANWSELLENSAEAQALLRDMGAGVTHLPKAPYYNLFPNARKILIPG